MVRKKLRDYLSFLWAFVSRPRSTGAVAPSSRALGEMMVRGFALERASHVVEIGPGTGPFTRVLLERLGEPSRYTGLELNPEFVRSLRTEFPRATFHQDSAEHLCRYAKDVDYVVCGLPWAIFSEDLQNNILNAIFDALRPGGQFSTFAYVHALRMPPAKRFRRMLERRFTEVETSPIVWKNIPPAIAYICRRA